MGSTTGVYASALDDGSDAGVDLIRAASVGFD